MRLTKVALPPGITVAATALALVLVFLAGCGWPEPPFARSSPTPKPGVVIASGRLSDDGSQVVDLGTHQVRGEVWVSWVLRGRWNSRAIFSLRLVKDGDVVAAVTHGPVSYGNLASISDDRSLTLEPVPSGSYRILLVEKVRPQWPHGYAATFKVLTRSE